MNEKLHHVLMEIFCTHPKLFHPKIQQENDVMEWYSSFRSFRRGSNTRATNKRVSKEVKSLVNRWKREEAAGQKRHAMPIYEHYIEMGLILQPFLDYTLAM